MFFFVVCLEVTLALRFCTFFPFAKAVTPRAVQLGVKKSGREVEDPNHFL